MGHVLREQFASRPEGGRSSVLGKAFQVEGTASVSPREGQCWVGLRNSQRKVCLAGHAGCEGGGAGGKEVRGARPGT